MLLLKALWQARPVLRKKTVTKSLGLGTKTSVVFSLQHCNFTKRFLRAGIALIAYMSPFSRYAQHNEIDTSVSLILQIRKPKLREVK